MTTFFKPELRGDIQRPSPTEAVARPESLEGCSAPPRPPPGVDTAASQSFNFDRWYREYKPLVSGIIRRFIVDPHVAEDLSQTVWLRISKVGVRFDPNRGKEGTFIAMITKRALMDHFRRECSARRRINQVSASGTDGDLFSELALPERDQTPLEAAVRAEEIAQLRKTVAELGPRSRAVLEGLYARGQKFSDISAEIDIPVGTVKSSLSRALKELRQLLRREQP